jgi:hypothetical protein
MEQSQLHKGVWFGVVYNRLRLTEPLYWFSLPIRVFTFGGNHSIEIENGIVKEYTAFSLAWRFKRLLGCPVSYLPNQGSGYRETPLNEWGKESTRVVKIYRPTVELCEVNTLHSGYSLLKIVQICLNTVRKKWLVSGNTWNGRDGAGRHKSDLFCSEYNALRLGFSKPYLITPGDLESVRELEWCFDFETNKQH